MQECIQGEAREIVPVFWRNCTVSLQKLYRNPSARSLALHKYYAKEPGRISLFWRTQAGIWSRHESLCLYHHPHT
jgi:hypothetical protein